MSDDLINKCDTPLDHVIAVAMRGDDKYKRWPLLEMIAGQDEITSLRARLEQAERERDEWAEKAMMMHPPTNTTPSVAEAFDPATENMIGWLLNCNADRIVLVDDFPHRCGLDLSMNDPCTGDILEVATLETEDSGYAPALWKLALEVLKQRRRALAAQTGDE